MTDIVVSRVAQPQAIATALGKRIQDLDKLIDESKSQVKGIKDRGVFASLVSNPRSEWVDVADKQSHINSHMLQLIQETIGLNVMSHAGLAEVLSNFNSYAQEGFRDSEGKLVTLSEFGKECVSAARTIMEQILEGSHKTQQRIEINAERIAEIHGFLDEKKRLLESHASQLDELRLLTEQKHALDVEQSEAIKGLAKGLELRARTEEEHAGAFLEIKSALLNKREALDTLSGQFADLAEQLARRSELDQREAEQLLRIEKVMAAQQQGNQEQSEKIVFLLNEIERKRARFTEQERFARDLHVVVQQLELSVKQVRTSLRTFSLVGLGCLVALSAAVTRLW